jgi:hypothetical protein
MAAKPIIPIKQRPPSIIIQITRFLILAVKCKPATIAFLHPDRGPLRVRVSIKRSPEINKRFHTIFSGQKIIPIGPVMGSAHVRVDCREESRFFSTIFISVRVDPLHRVIAPPRAFVESNAQAIDPGFDLAEFRVIARVDLH